MALSKGTTTHRILRITYLFIKQMFRNICSKNGSKHVDFWLGARLNVPPLDSMFQHIVHRSQDKGMSCRHYPAQNRFSPMCHQPLAPTLKRSENGENKALQAPVNLFSHIQLKHMELNQITM